MRMKSLQATGLMVALMSVMLSAPGYAQEPSGRTLRLGMSADFSGSAQRLGLGMKEGIEAAIKEVNVQGGVNGHKVELVALDDGYEPARTVPNMYQLIDQERVFAVLGNVGTPTAAVGVPIANKKETLFWGAFTGAGLLRKSSPDRYIFNYRASYAQETAKIVAGLIEGAKLEPSQIAFFTQNDAYGDSGYMGAISYLESIGYKDAKFLAHGRYTRNTLDVEDGLATLLDPRVQAKAVIMVGTAPPCAKLISLARRYGLVAHFIAVSFVGGDQLLELLGEEAGRGVIVSQVVPHPELSELSVVRRYREVLAQRARSFVSLEGYIAAWSLFEALKVAKVTSMTAQGREGFIDRLQDGVSLELGLEIPLKLSAQEHQLSHQVWPTLIHGGQIIPLVSWSELNTKYKL